MNRLNGVMGGILVAGFFGFLTIGSATAGEVISSQQILEALTAKPKPPSPFDRLRLTRSPTFGEPTLADAQSMPYIDLSVYFDFDSAEITPTAETQLRELGKALSNSQLKGAPISINGHTDAKGGETFNMHLSERRAQSIKIYLVERFGLSSSDLHTAGYGKSRLKNPSDPFGAENRRVEVVNTASQSQAQR
jgi:outer membrane protein OmpA-like peptidoglycan-associated protein